MHIKYLFEKEANLNYYGIDISELMIEEALRLNSEFTATERAIFELTDGKKISYPDSFFDSAFTANTLFLEKSRRIYK
ncbi:class I SAM-dependent methyltransferase [Flavobacterium lindanitolerans]|nr:class I SAM-dependent methyltransferase [Flavobacterium lindanitolerans]